MASVFDDLDDWLGHIISQDSQGFLNEENVKDVLERFKEASISKAQQLTARLHRKSCIRLKKYLNSLMVNSHLMWEVYMDLKNDVLSIIDTSISAYSYLEPAFKVWRSF